MFILSLSMFANAAFSEPQVVDKVAAVVDDGIVLESEVDTMLSIVKHSAQKNNQQLPDDATLHHQILDWLIIDNIILQLAKRANIAISDEQLDQVINNIIAQTHISLDQLRSRLAYLGMDYNTYRTQICKSMLIAEVRNSEVRQRVRILPQEVESLAQQIVAKTGNGAEYNLDHIFIPLPENPTQDQLDRVKALATLIVEKSKSGADFAKLIITYSTENQVLKSGQMGWWKLEELPHLFTARLQRAQKGSIIDPICSDVGFHILKVNDIRGGTKKVAITEVRVRHILLGTSVLMTDQRAQHKLKYITTKIKSGRISFATAAKQLSEDPGSLNQGGDLGWRSLDAFDPVFRATLMHMKKGEISPPLHSSLGWHLIQLIDTRQVEHTDAFQKDRAYRLLFNRKFAEEAQSWMQEQRAAAYVKIIDSNGP